MKRFFIIFVALSLQRLARGETLCFFVLTKDADSPEVRSSLQAYQTRTPKLGTPVLTVDSLASVDLTTTRFVSIMHDDNGKVAEETQQMPSIRITLPPGFQEKFGKITEENVDHRMMIALGDRILMAPMVRHGIDTTSFLISLGSTATSGEVTQTMDDLRAMVKRPEANMGSVASRNIPKIMTLDIPKTMTLDIDNDRKIENPTIDALRTAVQSLDVGKNGYGFVILGLTNMTYIQSSGDKKKGFDLEYQDGSLAKHYRAKESFTADQIVEIFWNYSQSGAEWKEAAHWEAEPVVR